MKNDFIDYFIQLDIGVLFLAALILIDADFVTNYIFGVVLAFSYHYYNHKKIESILPLFSMYYIIIKAFSCVFVLFCICFEFVENKLKRTK